MMEGHPINMVDPEPNVDVPNIPGADHLVRLDRGIDFPFAASFPIHAAVVQGQFHAVAVDAISQEARHVTLEPAGQPSGPPTALPLTYVSGAAACLDLLLVVGASPPADRPTALAIDSKGAVRWSTQVTLNPEATRWPSPVCIAGRWFLLWETENDGAALNICELTAGSSGPVAEVSVGGRTMGLDYVPAGTGLTVARICDEPLRLELLRLVDGQLLRRVTVEEAGFPAAVAVAAVGNRYAVLWISQPDRRLDWQWYDWTLEPLGPAEALVLAPTPGQFSSARFVQGEHGFLAINCQTVVYGHGALDESESGLAYSEEPLRSYRHFMGLYDAMQGRFASFQELVPPGTSYDLADWMGDRLLVVHGEREPLITIFQARRGEGL